MRLFYSHVWQSEAYRRSSATDRRLIELRIHIAQALRRTRKSLKVSQEELALRTGFAQATISRVERGSNLVTFDVGLKCLLALGATDAEIAAAFDLKTSSIVSALRRRVDAQRYYPKPETTTYEGEHRFVAKGSPATRRRFRFI